MVNAAIAGFLAYIISTDPNYLQNFTIGNVHVSARGLWKDGTTSHYCTNCPGLIPIIAHFVLALISLALIQFMKDCMCYSPWCKTNCFPMTEKTKMALPVLPEENLNGELLWVIT